MGRGMKRILSIALSAISLSSYAQNNCFTSCMAYQQNNPSAGQICNTTCNGVGGGGFVNPMDSFRQGYESTNRMIEDAKRQEMINRAKNDCNNGIQAGCEWLRRNNIY